MPSATKTPARSAKYITNYRVAGIAEHARFAPPFDHYNPARLVALRGQVVLIT
jgi:hypothetical protein